MDSSIAFSTELAGKRLVSQGLVQCLRKRMPRYGRALNLHMPEREGAALLDVFSQLYRPLGVLHKCSGYPSDFWVFIAHSRTALGSAQAVRVASRRVRTVVTRVRVFSTLPITVVPGLVAPPGLLFNHNRSPTTTHE